MDDKNPGQDIPKRRKTTVELLEDVVELLQRIEANTKVK